MGGKNVKPRKFDDLQFAVKNAPSFIPTTWNLLTGIFGVAFYCCKLLRYTFPSFFFIRSLFSCFRLKEIFILLV